MRKYLLLLFLPGSLLFSGACSKGEKANDTTIVPPPVTDTVPRAGYDISLLADCTAFEKKPQVTEMKNQLYVELSGIAPSRVKPGIFYVHEDSGNRNEVYITNTNGDDLGRIVLANVSNRDWEDIATGPGPDPNKRYIYVAEIGDNKAVYSSVIIYRFPEPELPAQGSVQTVLTVTAFDRIELNYPKGPVNAETLMIDPLTKDLYIATKEKARSTLFVARYPQSTTTKTMLAPLAYLPFDLLTSGDISADGSEVLVRSTGQIFYWKREAGESIAKCMLRAPQNAPYAANEPQGEGICFAADGSGYFTNSEIKNHPGYRSAFSFYKRK